MKENLPWSCIAPNVFSHMGWHGVFGTGFFCRLANSEQVFYVTARHCFRPEIELEAEGAVIPLRVTYNESKINAQSSDFVKFVRLIEIPALASECAATKEDLVILEVDSIANIDGYRFLLERAIVVSDGFVLDRLISLNNKISLCVIGYPFTNGNNVDYDVPRHGTYVISEKRGFNGFLSRNAQFSNRMSIENLSWAEHSTNGFSGSPVILQLSFKGSLLNLFFGVVLTGDSTRVEFLRADVLWKVLTATITASLS